jgi:hypothetical protein
VSKAARRFLITALVYLGLGLVLQAIGMFDVWLGFNPLSYTSVGSTLQSLLIGWLSQSVIALLYERLIKSPNLATVTWACLNGGLLLTIFGQPVLALTGSDLAGGLVALGGLMQAAGGAAFAFEVAQTMRVPR